jgi:hypothetical protein
MQREGGAAARSGAIRGRGVGTVEQTACAGVLRCWCCAARRTTPLRSCACIDNTCGVVSALGSADTPSGELSVCHRIASRIVLATHLTS